MFVLILLTTQFHFVVISAESKSSCSLVEENANNSISANSWRTYSHGINISHCRGKGQKVVIWLIVICKNLP